MKKAVYQLEPLTCPSCITKIESALKKKEGVQSVKVLFKSGKVRTEFNENEVSAHELADVIEKLGYQVFDTKVS